MQYRVERAARRMRKIALLVLVLFTCRGRFDFKTKVSLSTFGS